MADRYYTLASWYVRDGQAEEFVRIWQEELAPAFRRVSPEATGTLIQSLEDPRQYYSFGPWESLEAMQQARSDPAAGEAIGKLVSHCERAQPGPFRVVLTIP
jgi:heme-degrading monooxygenase HmoA